LLTFRAVVAGAIPILALVAYAAFALYGFYLNEKLITFRLGEPISKEDRWNAALYPDDARKWIARDRTWHKLKAVVWLGLIVVGNGLYFLIKP
jgi:hypothetical protein